MLLFVHSRSNCQGVSCLLHVRVSPPDSLSCSFSHLRKTDLLSKGHHDTKRNGTSNLEPGISNCFSLLGLRFRRGQVLMELLRLCVLRSLQGLFVCVSFQSSAVFLCAFEIQVQTATSSCKTEHIFCQKLLF